MKRTSLSGGGRVMDEWECENLIFNGGDQSSGFPWPQRNYICSYCKRVFNSAQALGGHMNVHRRDRARLRQLSSWGFESPKPNSSSGRNYNPNNVSSPTSSTLLSTKFSPCRHCPDKVSLLSPSAFCSSTSLREKQVEIEYPHFGCGPSSFESEDLSKEKSTKSAVNEASGGLKISDGQIHGLEDLKKDEAISLDLEMGCKDSREVLDLELRLGYSMNQFS